MPLVCILTQYFLPEMGAPQIQFYELGERLMDRGWDVEVLTALPNYPTGELFPGYSPLEPRVEMIGRLRTVRVPLYPSKTGFTKRMATYLSFVAAASALGPRLCTRPDVILVESPPLFIGWAAQWLGFRWKCPYVFNVSDLWPESAVRMGIVKPGVATRAAELAEKDIYRRAAGICGTSYEILDWIEKIVPGKPMELITTGASPANFGKDKADDAARALLGDEPGPVFLYAGLFGYAQGLDQALDIARDWPADKPGRFVLVGEGPTRDHLAARISKENISRVKLCPAQPRERISALLGAADVAFVSLGMSIIGAIPSKLWEAMASSLPIVLIADGEPAQIVRKVGCGITINPGEVAAARDACLKLAGDSSLRATLGAAGRVAAETTYNRDTIAGRLDLFLKRCM